MDTLFILCITLSMAELANSTSSVQPAITSNETSLDWVKITVVPLVVFLIGNCIWAIIVDTMARWSRTSLHVRGGGVHEATEMSSRRPVNNDSVEQELEEGLELSLHSMVVAPNRIVARDGMMQLEIESTPNDRETEVTATDVQPRPATLKRE